MCATVAAPLPSSIPVTFLVFFYSLHLHFELVGIRGVN